MQELQITGHTQLFGVIADPIHHVKTPQVINRLLKERGVDGVLIPIHATHRDLSTVLEGLRQMKNMRGFVVTVPHKSTMTDLCDELSAAARVVGAVNCVQRTDDGKFIGDIMDGVGFVNGFLSAGHSFENKSVCLVGAGGAAKAIAFALAEQPLRTLTVQNRTYDKARELVSRLRGAFPESSFSAVQSIEEDYDVVINSTSVGMTDNNALPFPSERLRPGQIVAEIIMEPAETALLKAAGHRGCVVHPGLPMLEQQAILMAQHMGAFA